MGVANRKIKLVTFDGSTEADALNFKITAEALAYSGDHVVNQGAGEAMKCTYGTLLIGTSHVEGCSLDGSSNALGEFPGELSFGSLDSHKTALIQSDFDS